jgi:hypothetical protein
MSKLARPVRSPSTPPRSVRTFFVTSGTWQRRPLFRSERMARLFLEVLYTYREQTPFRLHEFVLTPDHFHLLVSLPPGVTIERVVQLVRAAFPTGRARSWASLRKSGSADSRTGTSGARGSLKLALSTCGAILCGRGYRFGSRNIHTVRPTGVRRWMRGRSISAAKAAARRATAGERRG